MTERRHVKVLSYFYCSHDIESEVKVGETMSYVYETPDFILMFIIHVTGKHGFTYKDNGQLKTYCGYVTTNGSASYPLKLTSTYKICWDKEETNCLKMIYNRDGSWTIKSLPFYSRILDN